MKRLLAILLLIVSSLSLAGTTEENSQRLFNESICRSLSSSAQHIKTDHIYDADYISPNFSLKHYHGIVVPLAKRGYTLAIKADSEKRGSYFSADNLVVPQLWELPCDSVLDAYIEAIEQRAVLGPYKRSFFEALDQDYISPFFDFAKKAFFVTLIFVVLAILTFFEFIAIRITCFNFHLGVFVGSLFLSMAGGGLVVVSVRWISDLFGPSVKLPILLTSAVVYAVFFAICKFHAIRHPDTSANAED